MHKMIPRRTSGRRCSVFTVTVALVLLVQIASYLPAGARASAIRSVSVSSTAVASSAPITNTRHQRNAHSAVAPALSAHRRLVRKKRTLHKLKPLIVLPAKLAVGAGFKLAAGAKLGAKAIGLGAKAVDLGAKTLRASAVGLHAVKKVAKVTVKAATALGVKAVLLNFLFQKINQMLDFKTRLLSNLDQRNRQQNAHFLSPALSPSSSSVKSSSGSIGNKEDDDFLASAPGDQQVLAQEQSKSSAVASVAPLEEDEVTFDANKVSLQVPDTLFGPSFTAVNGISQTIGTVIQNAASRLARLVDAIKASIWRKASGVSAISNSSGGGGFGGKDSSTGTRGSRDVVADLGDDGLDPDPLDEKVVPSASEKRSVDSSSGAGNSTGHRR